MEDKLLIYGQESPWTNKGVLGRCPFPLSSTSRILKVVLSPPASRASFCLLLSEKKKTDGFMWMSSLWSHWSPNVWTDQSSVGFLSNWFSECEHPFIDKPLIIEPAVPSTRLLGLSSKLYPSNKQHMLNKDFSRFMESLTCGSKSSKWKKGSAKRVVLG